MLPTFHTPRLILRPRTMADFDACYAMDREPEMTRYIKGPWSDEAAHRAFLKDRIERDWPDGLGYWTMLARESGHFLGWILLIPLDGVGPEIKIGWRLTRAAWGKGYATEAAKPIAAHAFENVGVSRIIAEIDPRNAASRNVAEKIGMKWTSDGVFSDGDPSRCYALTRDDVAGFVGHGRAAGDVAKAREE
jgi:RimJ/RimL family protein N-acetyltransferase